MSKLTPEETNLAADTAYLAMLGQSKAVDMLASGVWSMTFLVALGNLCYTRAKYLIVNALAGHDWFKEKN